VGELAARSGVTTLSDLGVPAAAIPSIVEAVAQRPDLASSPGPPTPAQIGEIVAGAL
jgi:alcohol dehydrogenase class IV